MDGQMITQTVLLLRSVIDAAKALGALVTPRKERDQIPVYRLATRDQLLLARADRATDITPWRWPR